MQCERSAIRGAALYAGLAATSILVLDLLARGGIGQQIFTWTATLIELGLVVATSTLLYVLTRRMQARQDAALQSSELKSRLFFEFNPNALLVYQAGKRRIVDVNRAAQDQFGYGCGEFSALDLDALIVKREAKAFRSRMEALESSPPAAVDALESIPFENWTCVDRNGREMICEIKTVHLPCGPNRLRLALVRDLSAESESSAQAARDYKNQLSELTQRMLQQEQTTRARFSRALHDEVGHELVLIQLGIDRASLTFGISDELQSILGGVTENLNKSLQGIRELLVELRPSVLDDLGLVTALRAEIERMRLDGQRLRMSIVTGDSLTSTTRWPRDVEYAVFMIAREALMNVVRHANASLVELRLRGDGRYLLLQVRDDGRGLNMPADLNKPGHLGIVGMRERALAIQAKFSIKNRPINGTDVTVKWQKERIREHAVSG